MTDNQVKQLQFVSDHLKLARREPTASGKDALIDQALGVIYAMMEGPQFVEGSNAPPY